MHKVQDSEGGTSGEFCRWCPLVFVIALMLIASLLLMLFLNQGWMAQISDRYTQTNTPSDAVVIRGKIERLIDLPDEEPIWATVYDAEKLSDRDDVFEDAADGDRVLIFPHEKFVVVYRESEDRVVASGVVDVESNLDIGL